MPSRRSVTRWKAEAIQASTRVRPWGIPLGLGALHVPDQVDIEGRHWTDDDFKTKTFSSSFVLDHLTVFVTFVRLFPSEAELSEFLPLAVPVLASHSKLFPV